MATTIVMPKMGYDMREGTVVRWYKKEGEAVARGEVIADIETDKATVEFEAYTGGRAASAGGPGRGAGASWRGNCSDRRTGGRNSPGCSRGWQLKLLLQPERLPP